MNSSIKWIEFTEEKINFQTFPSSVYLGLIRRESMDISVPRILAEFRVSNRNYGFSKKYTGDVYILSYAGNEYLIESNFFDHFSELKSALESRE